tara:strand:- start:1017 stop:1358 length:342 start_codon:yes stop_codon:yes gene_type:complete
LLILTTFLTSCSTVSKLDVFKTEVERAPLNLDNPETPNLEEVRWIIITSENAAEVFAKMKEQGKDPVLFGLSDEDYELLSKNFAQIRAYMIQQGLTLEQYREYYEGAKEATTE